MPQFELGEFEWTPEWPFDADTLVPFSLTHKKSLRHNFVTIDKNGVVWLYEENFYYNSPASFIPLVQDISVWDNAPDLSKSVVLNFGDQVYYYEPNARPASLDWVYKVYYHPYPVTDEQSRVWFYNYDQGLIMAAPSGLQILSQIPDDLSNGDTGSVLLLRDGRVWVGSRGVIWEFDNWKSKAGHWKRIKVPDVNELFTYFVETKQGIIYAGTDTSVYEFADNKFEDTEFVAQGWRPATISKNGQRGDCTPLLVSKVNMENCYLSRELSYQRYNYEARLLELQEDGSVIYVNNHLVARLADGQWKSFFFDTVEIDSAAIDYDGYIWIFTDADGLWRLSPDIFEDYQGLQPTPSPTP